MERLQILNELALPLVQRCGADLDDVRVQIEQRLVEVLAEPDGFHALEFPSLQLTPLDGGFELLELGDDLFLRLVDQDAVVTLLRRILHAEEVRVVVFQVTVFKVRKLPLALAEGVVALGVLLEERNGDLLPEVTFS